MPSDEELTRICRCGHARRFHLRGTIWQGYETACQKVHSAGEYAETGCLFFEADGGTVVLRRDSHGRFRPMAANNGN